GPGSHRQLGPARKGHACQHRGGGRDRLQQKKGSREQEVSEPGCQQGGLPWAALLPPASPGRRVTATEVTFGHLPSVLRGTRLRRYSKDKFPPGFRVVSPHLWQGSPVYVRGLQWRQRA